MTSCYQKAYQLEFKQLDPQCRLSQIYYRMLQQTQETVKEGLETGQKGAQVGQAVASAGEKVMNITEKASEVAQGAVETTQQLAEKTNTYYNMLFERLDALMHQVNLKFRDSTAGKVFMAISALLMTTPVLTYTLYALGTLGTTLGVWALVQLFLLGVGLFFLFPVLFVCLLVSGSAGLMVAGGALGWKLTKMSWNKVIQLFYRAERTLEGEYQGGNWGGTVDYVKEKGAKAFGFDQ